MKVYLAAPFFTPGQRHVVARIRERLERFDHHIFDPELESRSVWKGRAPAECTDADRRQVLNLNRQGIMHADAVVAWLRGTGGNFTDQGVVWELGYAFAMGIPTIGFVAMEETAQEVNLMIAASIDAVVHETHITSALSTLAFQGTPGLAVYPKLITHEGPLT